MASSRILDQALDRVQITDLQRHPDGYHTATVTKGTHTVQVNNQHGAWIAVVTENGELVRQHILPRIAVELQAVLARHLRAEQKAAAT